MCLCGGCGGRVPCYNKYLIYYMFQDILVHLKKTKNQNNGWDILMIGQNPTLPVGTMSQVQPFFDFPTLPKPYDLLNNILKLGFCLVYFRRAMIVPSFRSNLTTKQKAAKLSSPTQNVVFPYFVKSRLHL